MRLLIVLPLACLLLFSGAASPPEAVAGSDRPHAIQDAVRSAAWNPAWNASAALSRPVLASATPKELNAEEGLASYVGKAYHNRRTACGEMNDIHALTAAHPTLPCGTTVRVTAARSGKSVVVRINDRGPFVEDRIIDVTLAAAKELNMVRRGVVRVRVERLE